MNKIKFWQLQLEAGFKENKDAADFLGASKRTIERWRSGKIEAPHAVIMCLQSIIQGRPVNKLKS